MRRHLLPFVSVVMTLPGAAATQGPPPPARPVDLAPRLSVVFWVTDLQRSADFFGKTLGARPLQLLEDVGFGELSTDVPGVYIGLARGRRPKGPDGPAVVPTFAVPSAAAASRRLAALGVALLRPVEEMPGLCRLVAFADPDGNEIQLVESLLPQAPADVEFAKVAFLVGGWRHAARGGVTEEVWTAPIGEVMHGQNRTTRGDELAMFELLRIARDDAGRLFYEARPAGRPATRFALVAHAEQRVTFANPDHDFPKRIHYWREGEELHAAIDDGRDDGKRIEFAWRRMR